MTPEELAALLMETGQHHHHAYIDSNGVDPEWALFYAGYLQTRLWEYLDVVPTRSTLVHLLVQGNIDHPGLPPAEWTAAYANDMLETIQPAGTDAD